MTSQSKIGSFNFSKYLRGLGEREGFSKLDYFKELIDNSFDARANNVYIYLDETDNSIAIVDDGHGMNEDKFKKIAEFYTEDETRTEESSGKFGIGAKKAMRGLSNLGKIEIVSKQEETNDIYYTTINFELYHSIEDYVNKVLLETTNQHDLWDKYNLKKLSGTIIKIYSDDKIFNEINIYYNSKSLDLNNMRLDFALTYQPYISDNKKLVINFNGTASEIPLFKFYNEGDLRKNKKIDIFKNKNGKLIFEYFNEKKDRIAFFPKSGGYNTAGEKYDTYNDEYIGSFTLDLSFPREIVSDKKCLIETPENIKHLLEVLEIGFPPEGDIIDFFKNIYVKRNNRILSFLPLMKRHIFKGTDTNCDKQIKHIKKKINFNSSLDKYVNLAQENKSSVSWKLCCIGFERVIHSCIKEFWQNNVKKLFEGKVVTHVTQQQNVYETYTSQDSYSDNDSDSEDQTEDLTNDESEDLTNDESEDLTNDESEDLTNEESEDLTNDESEVEAHNNDVKIMNPHAYLRGFGIDKKGKYNYLHLNETLKKLKKYGNNHLPDTLKKNQMLFKYGISNSSPKARDEGYSKYIISQIQKICHVDFEYLNKPKSDNARTIIEEYLWEEINSKLDKKMDKKSEWFVINLNDWHKICGVWRDFECKYQSRSLFQD